MGRPVDRYTNAPKSVLLIFFMKILICVTGFVLLQDKLQTYRVDGVDVAQETERN